VRLRVARRTLSESHSEHCESGGGCSPIETPVITFQPFSRSSRSTHGRGGRTGFSIITCSPTEPGGERHAAAQRGGVGRARAGVAGGALAGGARTSAESGTKLTSRCMGAVSSGKSMKWTRSPRPL